MTSQRQVQLAALLLRLSLSFFFFAHLYRKFGSVGFDRWWNGFIKEGYAGWMLSYTVAIEFAGAVLLLLGIYSRYVSVLAMPVLAAVCLHWSTRRGFWFADGGIEFPLAWLVMLGVQALLGDGACAVRVPRPFWENRIAGSATA